MPPPPEEPVDDLAETGERIGHAGLVIANKYELRHLLGEGGMGAVWAAMHLGLCQMVALKIISKQYAKSKEARRRFDQEAKAAARLKSRHVVQVIDNGELPDGTPFIAMELLEGESLHERIARGPLSMAEIVFVLDQTARALDRAHEQGIVHRDIKPENIFLAKSVDDDGGVTVKVLDFGIAKIATPEGGGSQTTTGVIMGTPLFMSPEQARGLRTLDYRSDFFSLGMVAFLLVTGRTAYTGESMIDLVVKVCTHPLPSLSSERRTFPVSLDEWFQVACHREPEQRFAKAREMADAFAVAVGVREKSSRDSGLVGAAGAVSITSVSSATSVSGYSPASYAPTMQSNDAPGTISTFEETKLSAAPPATSGGGKGLWGLVAGGLMLSGVAAFFVTRSFLSPSTRASVTPTTMATAPLASTAAPSAPSAQASAPSDPSAPSAAPGSPSLAASTSAASTPSVPPLAQSKPVSTGASAAKPATPTRKPAATASASPAGVEVGF